MKSFVYFLLFNCLILGMVSCTSDSSTTTVKAPEKTEDIIPIKVINPLPEAKETPVAAKKVGDKPSVTAETAVTSSKTTTTAEKQKKESTKTVEKDKSTASTSTTKKKTSKKKSSKKAKFKFDKELHEFGIIKPGDVIDYKFYFTNVGEADLVITKADVTCGCTTPSYPFVPIAPGERGFIGVTYDSTGKLGKQKPTVTLTTNAGKKKIYMEGYVISEMAEEKKPEKTEDNNNGQ